MYCPKCFNNSLHINSRGVMQIIINDRQMDAGRFLYDLENERQFKFDLQSKLEEFFKWYSGFQNAEEISKIEICTSDVSCDYKCAIPLITKFSVIDSVIPKKDLMNSLSNLGQKYKLDIKLA